MKQLIILTLFLLFSATQKVTAQSVESQSEDMVTLDGEEYEEIGNFDFLYFDSNDYDKNVARTEELMDEAFSHLGARYRYGSKGPKTFDCSGFTSYVYKQRTDINIGGSSRDQYARNTPISREELQCGDLVFFTSPRSRNGVGHVGLVVDVDPVTHHFSFIHASSTSGVKISQSTESNYARRYIGARRVKE